MTEPSSGTTDAPSDVPSSGPRLVRDRADGWIGGVCAAISASTGWEVSLVRIAATVVALAVFPVGVLVYLAMWWLLPVRSADGTVSGAGPRGAGLIGGVIAAVTVLFVAVGALSVVVGVGGWIFQRFLGPFGTPLGWLQPGLWPLLWIVLGLVGAVLLFRGANHGLRGPAESAAMGSGPTGEVARSAPLRPATRPRPPAVVGPLTLIAAVVLVLVSVAFGLLDVFRLNPGVVAGMTLGVLGIGLLVSARWGRGRGLLLVAVPLAIVLAGLPVARAHFDALGLQRDLSAADLRGRTTPVEVTAGRWVLDLRDARRQGVDRVVVRQVAGEIRIVIPADLRSIVTVSIGTGDADVARPSIEAASSMSGEPGSWAVARSLAADSPLSGDEMSTLGLAFWDDSVFVPQPDGDHGRVAREVLRLGPRNAEGRPLRVDAQLGVGRIVVIDPRWVGSAPDLPEPTQMCLTSGGAVGSVSPCGNVPPDQRVPVCISGGESYPSTVFDCRAIAEQHPEVACRDQHWSYRPCSVLGIEPDPNIAGAGAASPTATVPALGDPYPGDAAPEPIGLSEPTSETTTPPPPPGSPDPATPSQPDLSIQPVQPGPQGQ